MSKFIDK